LSERPRPRADSPPHREVAPHEDFPPRTLECSSRTRRSRSRRGTTAQGSVKKMRGVAIGLAAAAVLVLTVEARAQSKPAKPPVTSAPAAPTNYGAVASRKIDMIVIHDMEGYNAEVLFAQPGRQVSAHYSVHLDGKIYQCVPDHDIAWHAGNSAINDRSIGI